MKLPFTPATLPALPRPLRWLCAALVSLASIIMLVLMVVFIVLTVGTFWLSSTPHGQKWLSAQVSTLTASSGYEVDIGRLSALGASQIALSHVIIRQQETPVVTIEGVVLTPALAYLMAGELRFDLRARNVLIHSVDTPPDTAPAPVNAEGLLLPDAAMLAGVVDALPVQRIVIDAVHIGQLAMLATDGSATTVLSPILAARAEKNNDGMALSAVLDVTDHIADTSYQAQLAAHLATSGEAPALVIDSLTLHSAGLSQQVTARLTLPHDAQDLRPQTLSVQAPLPDDAAIDLSAQIVADARAPAITDLAITGPGVTASGAIAQKPDGIWHGALDARIAFQELARYLPQADQIPLRETLNITLSFDGPTLSLIIPRLSHTMADLRNITLSTAPISGAPAGSRSISLDARETTSKATLRARANVMYDDSGTHWRVTDIDTTLDLATAGKLLLGGNVDENTIDLTLSSAGLRLDRLTGALAAGNAPVRLGKTTLAATGPMAAPVITFNTQASPLNLPKGAPQIAITADARIADGMATLDATIASRALRTGTVTLHQPLTLSLSPFAFTLPEQGLEARAQLAGNLSALAGFLPATLVLSGDVNLDVRAEGNPLAPVSAGSLSLARTTLKDQTSGIALHDITLSARFDSDAIVIDTLSARDKREGVLSANGRLMLAPGQWPVDATLKMTRIDPFTRAAAPLATMPVIDGVLSADLRLTGARKDYLLAGSVSSEKLDITLPATFSSSVPQLNVVEKRTQQASDLPGLETLSLDIAASMPRQIFVRGWGLDAEFGGALEIGGTAAEPVVSGTLQTLRGRYEEFGRKFTLARARIDFRGAIPPSPYLDIVAETKVTDITAQVVLGGSASKPAVTFTSTPALPQEDVLAHILFGKDRASISPTQALQIAQTINRFSGGGGAGFDPLGQLRSGFGLDDLSVDSDGEGGTTVGAGKYIADNVYLQVGGGNKGGEAKVQVELTPNIKVESKIGQESQAGGGIFWEWEY